MKRKWLEFKVRMIVWFYWVRDFSWKPRIRKYTVCNCYTNEIEGPYFHGKATFVAFILNRVDRGRRWFVTTAY
jgi:hypothetical protein